MISKYLIFICDKYNYWFERNTGTQKLNKLKPVEQGKSKRRDVEKGPQEDCHGDCWGWGSLCPLQCQATEQATNLIWILFALKSTLNFEHFFRGVDKTKGVADTAQDKVEEVYETCAKNKMVEELKNSQFHQPTCCWKWVGGTNP